MDKEPLAAWSYSCTEEELFLCLKRGDLRKAGPLRIGIQTGILALLAVYSLVGFFLSGMTDWRTVFIAVVSIAVGILLLVVPDKRMRHEAERIAQAEKELHVYLYDEGLAFGSPEESLPFAACRPKLYEDMAVLRFAGGSLLAVPRRVMSEDDWTLFVEKMGTHAERGH